MVNVFVYLFIYLHKDLPTDCFSVSVGDFSPINGALCIGTHSLFFIYLCKYCIFLVYSLHICVCVGGGGGGVKHHHANGKVHSFTQSYCLTGDQVFRSKQFCE